MSIESLRNQYKNRRFDDIDEAEFRVDIEREVGTRGQDQMILRMLYNQAVALAGTTNLEAIIVRYEEMARVRLRLRTDLETLFQVGHLPESLRVMIYDQAVATHRPSEGGREADRVKELMVIYGKIASIAMLSYSEGMVAMVRKNQETQP